MFGPSTPPTGKDYRPPTGWLWWWALAIAIVGTFFVLMLRQQLPDPDVMPRIRLTVMVTLVAVGICAISATAHWWTHR